MKTIIKQTLCKTIAIVMCFTIFSLGAPMEVSFAKAKHPDVGIAPPTNVTSSSATLNAVITSDGGAQIADFGFILCWKNSDDYIVIPSNKEAWGRAPLKEDYNKGITLNADGTFSYTVPLTPGVQYEYYAYAVNKATTDWGTSTMTGITSSSGGASASPTPTESNTPSSASARHPDVDIAPPTNVTSTSATLNAVIKNNGGAQIADFGFILCWKNSDDYVVIPSNKEAWGRAALTADYNKGIKLNADGTFSYTVPLTPGVQYEYYAYAENVATTSWGTSTMTDIPVSGSSSGSSSSLPNNTSNIDGSGTLTPPAQGTAPTAPTTTSTTPTTPTGPSVDPSTNGAQPWSKASSWAIPELEKAQTLGLIPSSFNGLDFTNDITRAEFAAVSVKLYENLSGKVAATGGNPFTDTSDPEVIKAYNIGITNGTSTDKFSPGQFLSREQASTMLTRVYKAAALPGWTLSQDAKFPIKYTKPTAFMDDDLISAYAKASVYFMASKSIVVGIGGSNFAPKNNMTREQALAIAVRMADTLKGTVPEVDDAPPDESVSKQMVGIRARKCAW